MDFNWDKMAKFLNPQYPFGGHEELSSYKLGNYNLTH